MIGGQSVIIGLGRAINDCGMISDHKAWQSDQQKGNDHHTKGTMYLDAHSSISKSTRTPLGEGSLWKP